MEQQEEQKQEIIKHALLVENDEACRRVMSIYLQKLDYQVDFAVDGITAIQNVERKFYDLIIQDIGLSGGVSGKEVIQYIRQTKLNIDTPLIAWSAYVNENGEPNYLPLGADSALKKTCKIEELNKSIQQCLLTPRYERKLKYKLKIFQKKWQENCPADWVKIINDVPYLPYSILDEALHIINEYQQLVDFQQNKE